MLLPSASIAGFAYFSACRRIRAGAAQLPHSSSEADLENWQFKHFRFLGVIKPRQTSSLYIPAKANLFNVNGPQIMIPRSIVYGSLLTAITGHPNDTCYY